MFAAVLDNLTETLESYVIFTIIDFREDGGW